MFRGQRRQGAAESWRQRAINCALHTIAVTQARGFGPGQAYLDKQQARGKDITASLRLLSDVVFRTPQADQDIYAQTAPPASLAV